MLTNTKNLAANNQTSGLNNKTVTKTKSYRWMALSALCFSALFLFYKYVLQVSPSVMTTQLMQAFHLNATGLGNLAAMYFYAFLVVQLLAGPALDRFSPRRLTALALGVAAAGAFMFGHAHSFWSAALGRACMGAGVAFATVSYLKQVAVWFTPKRQGMLGGLLASAVGVGAVAGQAPLSLLVKNVGWRHSLTDCALAGAVLAALYFAFVRDQKNTTDHATDNATDNATKNTNAEQKQSSVWQNVKMVLSQKRNWVLTLYSGLAFSPLAVFAGLWGVPYLETAYHLTQTSAAASVTLSFVGLGLGAPCWGWLADKCQKRMTVMLSGTVLSLVACCVAMWAPGQETNLVRAALFLFGFGTGSFMLGFTVGKQLNATYVAATVVAMINTGDALLGAVTEPMVGKFLDLNWGGQSMHGVHVFSVSTYHHAFMLLPVYLCLALVFGFMLRKHEPKKLAA